MEYFYQIQKRSQKSPFAQILGRTDFSLFPVAGYLTNGQPDTTALLYFLFFYPFAQAHLGINDIIDVVNDRARGMKTIPILYGINGTINWIILFTILHIAAAILFVSVGGLIMILGVTLGLLLLLGANMIILKGRTTETWLKALPLFHLTMLTYVSSMIIDYFI